MKEYQNTELPSFWRTWSWSQEQISNQEFNDLYSLDVHYWTTQYDQCCEITFLTTILCANYRRPDICECAFQSSEDPKFAFSKIKLTQHFLKRGLSKHNSWVEYAFSFSNEAASTKKSVCRTINLINDDTIWIVAVSTLCGVLVKMAIESVVMDP